MHCFLWAATVFMAALKVFLKRRTVFQMRDMDRKKQQRIFIIALFFLFIYSIGYNVKASAATVYFSVEKFTIGQGYIVEPVEITIKDGEALSKTTERVLNQAGYTYKVEASSSYGWYLAGINNADNGNGMVPECIQDMAEDAPKTEDLHPAKQKNVYYPGLYAYSYTMYAGWMFYPNNQDMPVGAGNYFLKDGDVVRLRFTLYGIGADLDNGREGSLSLPNLDAVTKRMAVYNTNRKACDAKGYASVYESMKAVVSNMDSTPEEIEEAYNKLPTEEEMRQWGEELAAKEKEANEKAASDVIAKINALGTITLSKESAVTSARKAYDALNANAKKLVSSSVLAKLTAAEKKIADLKDEQALKKKYTPGKVVLKKAKPGKKKVTLSWKKIGTATGYQVFMSTKKSSGFKKIATIKKTKTVIFTKKKLKSKKTYYFRVCAYRKVGKTTYYGVYSAVKKAKVK